MRSEHSFQPVLAGKTSDAHLNPCSVALVQAAFGLRFLRQPKPLLPLVPHPRPRNARNQQPPTREALEVPNPPSHGGSKSLKALWCRRALRVDCLGLRALKLLFSSKHRATKYRTFPESPGSSSTLNPKPFKRVLPVEGPFARRRWRGSFPWTTGCRRTSGPWHRNSALPCSRGRRGLEDLGLGV